MNKKDETPKCLGIDWTPGEKSCEECPWKTPCRVKTTGKNPGRAVRVMAFTAPDYDWKGAAWHRVGADPNDPENPQDRVQLKVPMGKAVFVVLIPEDMDIEAMLKELKARYGR
jgi:hypothetical protein